jgi:hypothetical protein
MNLISEINEFKVGWIEELYSYWHRYNYKHNLIPNCAWIGFGLLLDRKFIGESIAGVVCIDWNNFNCKYLIRVIPKKIQNIWLRNIDSCFFWAVSKCYCYTITDSSIWFFLISNKFKRLYRHCSIGTSKNYTFIIPCSSFF